MIATVFHLVVFGALAIGFIVAAALFTALAIVIVTGGRAPPRRRRPKTHRPVRVLARTPHFDLAIDR